VASPGARHFDPRPEPDHEAVARSSYSSPGGTGKRLRGFLCLSAGPRQSLHKTGRRQLAPRLCFHLPARGRRTARAAVLKHEANAALSMSFRQRLRRSSKRGSRSAHQANSATVGCSTCQTLSSASCAKARTVYKPTRRTRKDPLISRLSHKSLHCL
jgi:hypothetical protein